MRIDWWNENAFTLRQLKLTNTFCKHIYYESFSYFTSSRDVGNSWCILRARILASDEDYSLEKKQYRYCGVELSYANFKEYIENHGG